MLSIDNKIISYKMDKKLELISLLEEKKDGVHLREISRILKTGMPNVSRYIKILEKEGVLKKEKYANTIKVMLKESLRTIAYLKQVHTEKFLKLQKKVQIAVEDFINELGAKPVIALIFGSYAKGNYGEDSDIDILLVYQKVESSKDIENIAKKISMRTNTKINVVYLDYINFKNNFLNKNHDFSKEIRQNVIIFIGIEVYYQLLWRFLE